MKGNEEKKRATAFWLEALLQELEIEKLYFSGAQEWVLEKKSEEGEN